jgi:hypothetical protein
MHDLTNFFLPFQFGPSKETIGREQVPSRGSGRSWDAGAASRLATAWLPKSTRKRRGQTLGENTHNTGDYGVSVSARSYESGEI